ncbi:Protein C3Orf33 [Manis pentadactyla]|nr:Protein C3Orf33 [Manis pentadactyla]
MLKPRGCLLSLDSGPQIGQNGKDWILLSSTKSQWDWLKSRSEAFSICLQSLFAFFYDHMKLEKPPKAKSFSGVGQFPSVQQEGLV